MAPSFHGIGAGGGVPIGLKSDQVFATVAVLETAFPAASNSGNRFLVTIGTGSDPIIVESNGSTWIPCRIGQGEVYQPASYTAAPNPTGVALVAGNIQVPQDTGRIHAWTGAAWEIYFSPPVANVAALPAEAGLVTIAENLPVLVEDRDLIHTWNGSAWVRPNAKLGDVADYSALTALSGDLQNGDAAAVDALGDLVYTRAAGTFARPAGILPAVAAYSSLLATAAGSQNGDTATVTGTGVEYVKTASTYQPWLRRCINGKAIASVANVVGFDGASSPTAQGYDASASVGTENTDWSIVASGGIVTFSDLTNGGLIQLLYNGQPPYTAAGRNACLLKQARVHTTAGTGTLASFEFREAVSKRRVGLAAFSTSGNWRWNDATNTDTGVAHNTAKDLELWSDGTTVFLFVDGAAAPSASLALTSFVVFGGADSFTQYIAVANNTTATAKLDTTGFSSWSYSLVS